MDGWLEILPRRLRGPSCLSGPALPTWAANRICCLCSLFFLPCSFSSFAGFVFSLCACVGRALISVSRARSLVFGLWSGTRQDWTGLDRQRELGHGNGHGARHASYMGVAFLVLLFAAELDTSLRIRG